MSAFLHFCPFVPNQPVHLRGVNKGLGSAFNGAT